MPTDQGLSDRPLPRGTAMALMVLGSTSISFSGLVIRNIEMADAWQLNFYRALSLVVSITIFMLLRYRRSTLTQIVNIGSPGIVCGLLLGLAGMTFLQSITTTTVANTLFICSSIPFFTAAMAWLLLKETLRRSTVLTMLIAATGIGVMVVGGISAGSTYGNGMALLTALLFSGYAVIVRQYRNVEMLPVLIVSGIVILSVSGGVSYANLVIPLHDLLLCFVLGGLLSGFANALFIVASRSLAAAELTLFMLLEFSLGPVWVWWFIDERPRVLTIVGGTIVILAVAVRSVMELRLGSRQLRRGRPGLI